MANGECGIKRRRRSAEAETKTIAKDNSQTSDEQTFSWAMGRDYEIPWMRYNRPYELFFEVNSADKEKK